MSKHETAGAELIPAKRKNLPVRILRAFDNAKHLTGIKRGVRDTLAELCRYVAQDRPFETIFAHKASIADRIGASERTVYRHLQTLQDLGLVEVLPQERKSRNGRFAVARIRLTAQAAALLGLCEGTDSAALPSPTLSRPSHMDAAPQVSAPSDNAADSQLIHSIPSDNLSSGYTLTEPTISKHQPPSRIENGLPIDLAWLTGQGVSRAGIFKLMGLCTRLGKRLSDIALAVRRHLVDLKGGRLYSYLAKLAAGPTDFSTMAANERKRLQDLKRAEAVQRKTAEFRSRFRNATLTNRAMTRVFQIDQKAAFVRVFTDRGTFTSPLTDCMDWISRIERGDLVFATRAVERQFGL